tara:strand:+ start:14858 stop:15694 length:837 start_codon:yes stop_codon:yes gene_type:complete
MSLSPRAKEKKYTRDLFAIFLLKNHNLKEDNLKSIFSDVKSDSSSHKSQLSSTNESHKKKAFLGFDIDMLDERKIQHYKENFYLYQIMADIFKITIMNMNSGPKKIPEAERRKTDYKKKYSITEDVVKDIMDKNYKRLPKEYTGNKENKRYAGGILQVFDNMIYGDLHNRIDLHTLLMKITGYYIPYLIYHKRFAKMLEEQQSVYKPFSERNFPNQDPILYQKFENYLMNFMDIDPLKRNICMVFDQTIYQKSFFVEPKDKKRFKRRIEKILKKMKTK